jgi:hypothetical protein
MDNTITGNQGGLMSSGGGICCGAGSPLIINNTINGNIVAYYGGGIYCGGSTATIKSNIIKDNDCGMQSGTGGGIYVSGGAPEIVNNIIKGNYADLEGGGMYCGTGDIVIMNNTIVNNTGFFGAGGISVEKGASPVITNTIVWNNSVGEIYGGNPSVNFCCIKGGYPGEGNIDTYPELTGNQLTWKSPCINRGTNVHAPLDDFQGDPRPFMGAVDMGADEFTGDHSFGADLFTLPEAGGSIAFALNARSNNGNRTYMIFGGVTGTAPGYLLPGGYSRLAVNWDWFTDFVLILVNTPLFSGFMGKLNGNGCGAAKLNAPMLPSGYTGIKMYFAYAVNATFQQYFVSNPVEIEIVP